MFLRLTSLSLRLTRFAAIVFLFGMVAANTAHAAERTAHQLYDALNALHIDPATAYHIKPEDRIELRRADAKISFDQGELLFFAPLDGQVNGVVFAGRGHILSLPRDSVEKQQLARFLGAPILDQDFTSAYIRFSDSTAEDLQKQLEKIPIATESDSTAAARWEPILERNAPAQSLRFVLGTLLAAHQPYFYAQLDGFATGPFDLLIDPLRMEPFVLGQSGKNSTYSSYDVWASYKLPGIAAPAVDFRAIHYAIDTSILPDRSLHASADITVRSEAAGDRFLIFSLSRALEIESITGPTGQALEFFQNEGLTRHQRSVQGNDYLLVTLPAGIPHNSEFPIHLKYRGNIIDDAGNDVLFVGARESWYPHLGDSADFATYDLTMRWPRRLRLIATGTKLDEREDGDFRVGHWKTEKPVAVAGFNLGEYATISVNAQNYAIDVYANHQLEQQLAQRLEPNVAPLPSFGGHSGAPRPSLMSRDLSPAAPSPSAALKQLGQNIDASIRFFESWSGPFPYRSLSVSQIPGTFGQGWPGLLYLSTLSFLPDDAQRHAGLSDTSREHFTELVPFHEVAHQWWGNVVGWSSYRDQWIDEAMANYLTLLFAETRKIRTTRYICGWSAIANCSLPSRPIPTSRPAMSAHWPSVRASILPNRPTPTTTSSTPKAPGLSTCCARCCVSPAPSLMPAFTICLKRSPPNTLTALSPPKTSVAKSKRS